LLTTVQNAASAQSFDIPLRQMTKSNKVALDLTLLTQEKPRTHIIGPGDILNVYVHGVFPAGLTEIPVVHQTQAVGQQYFPPTGTVKSPSFGIPLEVSADGTLQLPLIGKIDVAGLTIAELQQSMSYEYVSKGIIEQYRERIIVTLARSRTFRVLVIREDSGAEQPQMISRNSVPYTKHGRAQIVDLPAFENDVLHALAATGGLPGIDAENEVWVLRKQHVPSSLARQVAGNLPSREMITELERNNLAVRIPLRFDPNNPVSLARDDVILNEGDIVYVPSRSEFFYTAGLLPAGKIPLPRDEDLDVIQAAAIAGGSIGGSGGASGSSIFRGGGLGGVVPPSLLAVVRTLPSGEQVLMRVNLAKAMKDPQERVIVQPGDVLFLQYTRGELITNMLLNFLNFNFLLSSAAL